MDDKQWNHLENRLDRIETKLDSSLQRISASETSIEWIRGHVRIVTTISVTICGFLLTALYQLLFTK